MHIVVGVDGSEASHKALAWAVAEARLRKADVKVVHAWSYVQPGGNTLQTPPVPIELLEQSATAVLEAALASVDSSGVAVEAKPLPGGAAHVLVSEAQDADLLVVGSRGHGGFAGLLLGSVSQQVSHHAPCPVVIVPGDDD